MIERKPLIPEKEDNQSRMDTIRTAPQSRDLTMFLLIENLIERLYHVQEPEGIGVFISASALKFSVLARTLSSLHFGR